MAPPCLQQSLGTENDHHEHLSNSAPFLIPQVSNINVIYSQKKQHKTPKILRKKRQRRQVKKYETSSKKSKNNLNEP
jgi:hypothetical protein